MLKIEKLSCENPRFHKNCEWVNVRVSYPDTRFLLLKERLAREVLRTHTAYRIIHKKFGVLTTLKMGHDNKIFIQDDNDALRKMLFYNPIGG